MPAVSEILMTKYNRRHFDKTLYVIQSFNVVRLNNITANNLMLNGYSKLVDNELAKISVKEKGNI